jgi:hypothetical protein
VLRGRSGGRLRQQRRAYPRFARRETAIAR